MRKIILSLALVVCPVTSLAVSIEEALTSGYNHNEELKSIRIDFLTAIESFPQALAGFMPKISAGMSSVDSRNTTTSALTNAAATNYNNTRYNRVVTIDQPIFDGWSSVAALKAAQSGFRAARGDYYSKEQEIFLKEINTYLGCVAAKEKYNISKISVKSNKAQLEAMKEKFKLGEATETEVASAREGLATAEANQALSYANYEFAKANFMQTFGVAAVGVTLPSTPSDFPSNLELFTELALASNLSIQSAQHQTKSLKATEYAAKGKLLPSASLRVENGKTQYLPERGAPSYNLNSNSTTTTLSVTVPIIARGGAEYSDIRRAKYQTKKSIISLDHVIKQIKANCQGRWSAFEAAKTRVKATEQAVKAAKIAYEGMIQEELFGSKTIIDVLRAEERLNGAREGRVEAKKDLVLAAYQMKSLLGDLTARSLHLKVDYFNPEEEFKKIKNKIVGF